jgi:hypothetical protein
VAPAAAAAAIRMGRSLGKARQKDLAVVAQDKEPNTHIVSLVEAVTDDVLYSSLSRAPWRPVLNKSCSIIHDVLVGSHSCTYTHHTLCLNKGCHSIVDVVDYR